MTGRSRRGRWERVVSARRQAREAIGRDPASGDYASRPKPRSPLPPLPGISWTAHGPGVRALFVGEAALRLGRSRAQLEDLISRGQVETLPIEFTRVVPVGEVKRLDNAT